MIIRDLSAEEVRPNPGTALGVGEGPLCGEFGGIDESNLGGT